jgi:hypothetical protein
LLLDHRNVAVGLDVSEPFVLPAGGCLDVSPGTDRNGRNAWFVRYYAVDDTFKHSVSRGATYCGKALAEWLNAAGVAHSDLWSGDTPESERTLWNARLFPAESEHEMYRRWRWMLDIDRATPEEKSSLLAADRYSPAEIAVRVDHEAFHRRRAAIRVEEIRRSLHRLFHRNSAFSPRDLAFALKNSGNRAALVADVLGFARELGTSGRRDVTAGDVLPRVIHSLGTAMNVLCEDTDTPVGRAVPGLAATLPKATLDWMDSACISLRKGVSVREWALSLHSLALRCGGG